MAEKSFGNPIDKMTAYCTYCPKMCRFSCPAAEAEGRETVTPWGMMRLLELVKDGSVEPCDEVAEIFYHCMGCRRCETWCAHGNDVPRAMWEARSWLAELGYIPEKLHDFREAFQRGNSPFVRDPALPTVRNLTVDDVFDPTSDVVFFPDCETRYHYPELVIQAGRLLEIFNGGKVRLITRIDGDGFGCCGFPLLSAGHKQDHNAHIRALDELFTEARLVITDCAAMVSMYRDETSWGRWEDLRVRHLIEFLAERVDFVEPSHRVETDGIMLHDSCFVGRQLNLYEETRKLAAAFCTEPPGEFEANREDASCCGAPSHYHVVAPEASEQCAEDILEQMEREGGSAVLCGSATCKKAFQRARDENIALDILELACLAFDLTE